MDIQRNINMIMHSMRLDGYNDFENSIDYREAIGMFTFPWGPKKYITPRVIGGSPTDVTSFMPGQQWSLKTLPNILYYIDPPPGWAEFKRKPVGIKRDAAGNVIMERWPLPDKQPRPLRDFRALPDQIGTMEHPIFLLAYRKLEPAATWEDILMRMENLDSRPVSGNTLSMRINRILDHFSIIYTWHGTKDWNNPTYDQKQRLFALSDEARKNNTTRGFTPGLIDPGKGEEGGRIPVPKLNGKCEGRGPTWKSRYGIDEGEEATETARTRKSRSTRSLTTGEDDFTPIEIDEVEDVDVYWDEPCPDFEIDYLAMFHERYETGYVYSQFDTAPRYSQEVASLESPGPNTVVETQSIKPNGSFQSLRNQPAAPIIGFGAQPFAPNASFQNLGNQPAPPAISFTAELFDPNISFHPFDEHSAAPIIGFETQPFKPNAGFEPLQYQPAIAFEESLDPHGSGTQSHFQSSDYQSASYFENHTGPQDYEPQPGFNVSDHQRFPPANLSVAETPFDLDLIGGNAEDNTFAFEEPVNYVSDRRSAFNPLMHGRENLPFY